MHKTVGEAVQLASQLVIALRGVEHKVMVAPPFTALQAVGEALRGTNVILGAQNMASEEQGAHTGEVSVLMLKDLGVKTVILGHSERRHIYGEEDGLINAKLRLALKHGLEVILCVGETLDEREAGEVDEVVLGQVEQGLQNVSTNEVGAVTIAYEPVWAIGTGKNATPDDAEQVHRTIRQRIAGLYSESVAQAMVIQYGGSVKPDNAASLMAMEDVDGALVGGASLKADSFSAIAHF